VHRQQGVALLLVLVILLAVGASSAAFIWFMQQQQTRAGLRHRSAAALAAAEAGAIEHWRSSRPSLPRPARRAARGVPPLIPRRSPPGRSRDASRSPWPTRPMDRS